MLRTSVPADRLDPPGVVLAYKNLAHVERDFRTIKTDDLDLRPIHHRLDDRVRAHVLICMLAAYLVWHLRRAWAPLTYTDEHPPDPGQPRRPRHPLHRTPRPRPPATTTTTDQPLRSFRGLLAHLATLTRNDLRYADTEPLVPTLTQPTDTQRRAFELLHTPIPLTLK